MTCGIYKLVFQNTAKVYIGQSQNIENRFCKHIYKLKNTTHTDKLNEAYKLYGLPSVEILAECTVQELDLFENETIEIYDAVNKGFNKARSASGKGICCGEYNSNSGYSNAQIIEVFEYIIDHIDMTLKYISEETEVSYNVVAQISKGVAHKWLSEIYPDKYLLLEKQRKLRHSFANSAQAHGIVYPKIRSPTGEVFTVQSNKYFAIEHGLDPANLHKVLTHKAKTHKGWKLAEKGE